MNAQATLIQTRPPSSPDKDALTRGFVHHLKFTQGKDWDSATRHDQFVAIALTVRDHMVDRMIATQTAYHQKDVKRVYYLSMEYLLGKQLRDNLVSLGLFETCRDGLAGLKIDLDALCDYEPEAGLGNGGLGRLAACYLDAAATLCYPAYGYGIRYEYGIFEQDIVGGWQIERPDDWLRFGSPWEIARLDLSTPVRMYGHIEERCDSQGNRRPLWRDARTVVAVPYDIPVVGYRGNTVNLLRLWAARASEGFDLAAFNRGGYVEAVREKSLSETLSKVLYPDDRLDAGKELRLVQQYFFVACTMADILRRYEKNHVRLDELPDKVAIQLNDTHPALAIAELMRIMVDDRGLEWNRAWELTRRTFSYTNHTLLPEALEQWPVWLLEKAVPRHLQIIYEINQRFLDDQVERRWPGDLGRRQRLSLVSEGPTRSIRMAHLSIVGSHTVNGVAELHTHLLRTRLAADFNELWPERFRNVTNGVTPRRWMLACNPGLSQAITGRIGDGWTRDLDELRRLEPLADDAGFHAELREIKSANKKRLADWVASQMGVRLDPAALFDVQVKRLHEYKRQLLNLLHVIIRYHRLRDDPRVDLPPRVVLFAAKAAPAYGRAKLIIKLINEVARTINADPRLRDRLRVLFLPNYRVSLAELVIPAADLSEQISTAGMEASGTGNMKFALNGALTIGTLDGANIEIRQAVGAENFFLFGLTADEVAQRRPSYDPVFIYQNHGDVRRALDALQAGEFHPHTPDLAHPVVEWLLAERDYYMLLADIESYLDAQARVDAAWSRPSSWMRSVVLNIARMGHFSCDRAVHEYAQHIWRLAPLPIDLDGTPLPAPARRRGR